MAERIKIEGLLPVVPNVPAPKGPQSISEAELGQIVRNYNGPQKDIQLASSVLLDINAKLQFRADTDRNPNNTGVPSFRIALIGTDPKANQNPDFVSAGDSLAFISIRTGEHVVVDALPASGFPENSYQNPTANYLVEKDKIKGS